MIGKIERVPLREVCHALAGGLHHAQLLTSACCSCAGAPLHSG